MAKNTFCILFFIKKNEIKQSGMATIMVRLTINGEQCQFSSRISITPTLWDQKAKRVVGNEESAILINRQLDTISKDIQNHYIRLSEGMQYVPVHRLRQAYLANEEETLLSYQFREQIKIYRSKAGRNICNATVDIYKLTMERLIEFMEINYKVSDIHMYKIDLWFLEKFFLFLRKKYKCSNNTSIKYMKRFASVMNFAQKTGLIQINPFNIFRFHIEKKEPAYLTEEELKRIIDKEFISERISVVRDAFVFSCFTGLSFSDIKALRVSDIQKKDTRHRVRVARVKTGTISYIPLLDIPLRIYEKYNSRINKDRNENGKNENSFNSLLFPVKSNQNTNEYLKEIADICGINKKISYHLARHSFATIALNNGVSIESVSKMLGHTSIRTTQVYANITDKKVNHEMDRMEQSLVI